MSEQNTKRKEEDKRNTPHNGEKLSPIEVQKHLAGVDYPATKEDLIGIAKEENADEKVMSFLNSLPDQEFHSPVEIMRMFGSGKEHRRQDEGDQAKAG